jgi:putative ABC transport system permease protein
MLTVKNLGRNKRRTILTVLAIALPLLVFLITSSMKRQIEETFAEMENSMRVATHQKLTYTQMLPQRIRKEIEGLAPDGYLEGVCRATWFGGEIENTQFAFPSMAVDNDTFHIVYNDYKMTAEEVNRFNEEKRGAVVGKQFAKSVNVAVGDKVTLKGTIPPFPEMEFVIVAIPEGLDDVWLYFRLDYYDEVFREMTGRPIGVHNFWMRCKNKQARQWALQEIDRYYANSQHETRTETEVTFIRSFVESGGDWIGLAFTVGCMVVFVALSVGFNTMSMSFRERISEFAVLRALGFSAGRIVLMVLSEGLLLGFFGGVLAVAPMFLLTNLGEVNIPQVGPFVIDSSQAGFALIVAILCGMAAGLIPALLAGRLEVTSALRKVV